MSELEEMMSANVVTITEETTIPEAIALLVKHNITGLPVVDKTMKLIGIISEKDILKIAYSFQTKKYDSSNPANTIQSVMSTDIVSFDINDRISDICKCLMESEFRRVPILKDGRVVGIVSRKDLLEILPVTTTSDTMCRRV
ncbi:MAG TPA: CBS domain-containing protein [Phycisphaerales bacterium]|nr:CBS domain-containing protein [Phycisphaerales bacterium]